jgi:hypothetical protein
MIKRELERKVLAFLKEQPGYSNAKFSIACENSDTWYILYGPDPQSGIAGFGDTAGTAFKDFKANWEKYGGETWLNKNAGQT